MVKFIVNYYFIYCPRNNFSAQRYKKEMESTNFNVFLHFCYIIIRMIPAAIAPNIPIVYIAPLSVEGLVMGKYSISQVSR